MPTGVSTPHLVSSRNYPGFLAAFFIVLLRIAIGWHFLTEGLEKVESTRHGNQPFSAEVYLRNSTGPLAPYFRGMLPDVNGLALLDPARLKSGWSETVERIEKHYGFDQQQQDKAKKLLEDSQPVGRLLVQQLSRTERPARNTSPSWPRCRRWNGIRTPCRSSANVPGSRGDLSRPTARS